MDLKVYKFGGASVKDADGVKNVRDILQAHAKKGKILTVVSATGKTTNALEVVTNSYFSNDGKAYEHLQAIKDDHVGIMKGLDIFSEDVVAALEEYLVLALDRPRFSQLRRDDSSNRC